jgi:hypothetical protein
MDELSLMAQAYNSSNAFDFSVHSARLRKAMRDINPGAYPTDSMLQLEYNYNHLQLFMWAVMDLCRRLHRPDHRQCQRGPREIPDHHRHHPRRRRRPRAGWRHHDALHHRRAPASDEHV